VKIKFLLRLHVLANLLYISLNFFRLLHSLNILNFFHSPLKTGLRSNLSRLGSETGCMAGNLLTPNILPRITDRRQRLSGLGFETGYAGKTISSHFGTKIVLLANPVPELSPD
jgi:hypothetical protein